MSPRRRSRFRTRLRGCAIALVALLAAAPLAALEMPWRAQGWTAEEAAAHLLSRFAFGPRPGEVERVAADPEGWFEAQLAAAAGEPVLEARLARLPSLDLPAAEYGRRYPSIGALLAEAQEAGVLPPDLDAATLSAEDLAPLRAQILTFAHERGYRGLYELLGELLAQKVLRAVYAENQLREVMTDFWFNHFNVSVEDPLARPYVLAYERDAIRAHALGRFRDLLGATARHPAMLFYLDNARSTGLNENYARELLELHTLGVDGGYTQEDVVEVARAFSGWAALPPGTPPERMAELPSGPRPPGRASSSRMPSSSAPVPTTPVPRPCSATVCAPAGGSRTGGGARHPGSSPRHGAARRPRAGRALRVGRSAAGSGRAAGRGLDGDRRRRPRPPAGPGRRAGVLEPRGASGEDQVAVRAGDLGRARARGRGLAAAGAGRVGAAHGPAALRLPGADGLPGRRDAVGQRRGAAQPHELRARAGGGPRRRRPGRPRPADRRPRAGEPCRGSRDALARLAAGSARRSGRGGPGGARRVSRSRREGRGGGVRRADRPRRSFADGSAGVRGASGRPSRTPRRSLRRRFPPASAARAGDRAERPRAGGRRDPRSPEFQRR
ncbi:MAG: DUF1800 family protein [Thermoanaerobaculia bacterium]